VIVRDRLIRQVLTAAGFSESMTFAFIERQAAMPFCEPGTEPPAIANPLSEKFAALRPSLLPGLLDSCVHNRRRERRDVRLFETGSRFTAEGEGRAAAFAWCGAADGPHWSGASRQVDFFDAKGVVQLLGQALGVPLELAPGTRPFLADGRAAEIVAAMDGGRTVLGVVGQIAPAVAEARGFPAA
jgi:phenylalanyl-tRNA synthetase beta chain